MNYFYISNSVTVFYADDTVILTETADDLQNALNECSLYGEQ